MRIACLLSYPSIAFFTALFIPLAIGLPGCGGGANPSATVADLSSSPADMGDMMSCPAAAEDAGTPHSLSVKIQLTDDGMGVPFFAQNGSMVHVPKADLVGKQFVYATAKGGDQVANGKMIDIGAGTIGNDLTAMFTTAAHCPAGVRWAGSSASPRCRGPSPRDHSGSERRW